MIKISKIIAPRTKTHQGNLYSYGDENGKEEVRRGNEMMMRGGAREGGWWGTLGYDIMSADVGGV